jgi:predicted DsbA family dithiol-disulfide isomerase
MRSGSHPVSGTTGTAPRRGDDGDAPPGARLLEVTYYTDPLCPWSWALEPQCRRLRLGYGGRLGWRHVMGGMIVDWRTYHDPLNAVHNPAQMGLQCYQVRQLTGMPLDGQIWHDDPPASSYPACLAVKAAERQGPGAGEAYLRRAREAVMLGRRNVARAEVLMELAEELANDPPPRVAFDVERFRDDLLGPDVTNAFHEDLRQVRFRAIGRFPTLVLSAEGQPEIALAGYRPYEVIVKALARLAPDAPPPHPCGDVVAYVTYWGRATGHEVAEALAVDRPAALRALDDAVAAGELSRDESLPEGYRARSD